MRNAFDKNRPENYERDPEHFCALFFTSINNKIIKILAILRLVFSIAR